MFLLDSRKRKFKTSKYNRWNFSNRVNTMNYNGKNKSRYTKAGFIKGKSSDFKKAIIMLAEGDTIDFYSNI